MEVIRVFKEDYTGEVPGASLRSANHDDYESVMDINRDIYEGADYLPVLYHKWIDDPLKLCYVCIREATVVGFIALVVVDGGQSFVINAMRVHPDHSGMGLASYMIDKSVIDGKKRIQTVKQIMYTSAKSGQIDRALVWNKAMKLVFKTTMLQLNISDLSALETMAKSSKLSKHKRVITCSQSESLKTLKNLTKPNLEQLFPDGIMVVLWEPFTVDPNCSNESNYKIVTEEYESFVMVTYDEEDTKELKIGTGSNDTNAQTGNKKFESEKVIDSDGKSNFASSISFGSVSHVGGGISYVIDYYSCIKLLEDDVIMLSAHLVNHIAHLGHHLATYMENCKQFFGIRIFFPEYIEASTVENMLADLGFDGIFETSKILAVSCIKQGV